MVHPRNSQRCHTSGWGFTRRTARDRLRRRDGLTGSERSRRSQSWGNTERISCAVNIGGWVGPTTFPACLTQGETLEEARENLRDAIRLMREPAPVEELPDASPAELIQEVIEA